MPGEILLELDKVTISRRGARVLDGLSLELRAKEILGIVFVHGVGRSTLLRVAAGLLAPDAGSVLWRGKEVSTLGLADLARFREKTAMVFSNGGLLVNTTCFNNIALPLRYHTKLSEAEVEKRAMDALSFVGLPQVRDRFPWELTIGQVRLVALARALVREPEIIFFDNFFQGSEGVMWRKLTRAVLDARAQRGTSFVLILESDPSVYPLADRLCVIEDGRVLETSAPSTMRRSKDKRVSGIFQIGAFGEEPP
jgi:phospholipid/cholesterol/gamma-HCH transport system ATP-binding protein